MASLTDRAEQYANVNGQTRVSWKIGYETLTRCGEDHANTSSNVPNGTIRMGLPTVESEHGEAGFRAGVRGIDEAGHYTFFVRLKNTVMLFGEWRAKWAANQNDFDVEIVRFGYVDENAVDSEHPLARRRFSREQRQVVQHLIRSLFSEPVARNGPIPFSMKSATFLGGVDFRPEWILENQ